MHFSAINPRYVWLGSLDYECLAGRWDGSTGKGTGNTSSMEIGAGRAMGARGMQCGEEDAAPLVQGGRWL